MKFWWQFFVTCCIHLTLWMSDLYMWRQQGATLGLENPNNSVKYPCIILPYLTSSVNSSVWLWGGKNCQFFFFFSVIRSLKNLTLAECKLNSTYNLNFNLKKDTSFISICIYKALFKQITLLKNGTCFFIFVFFFFNKIRKCL